jgi:hypothetical protein
LKLSRPQRKVFLLQTLKQRWKKCNGLICPHCGKYIEVFGTGGVEKASEDFNIPILARLPIEPKVAEMEDKGSVVRGLLEHNTEWQKNFEYVVNAVEKNPRRKISGL